MKLLRYLILAVLLTSLVAACSGGDDDDDPTEVSDGKPTAAATAEGETTATTDGSDSTATGEPDSSDATGTAATAVPRATSTPVPRTTPTPVVEFNDEEFVVGWNIALRGDEEDNQHNNRAAELAVDSGVTWVRFQIPWSQIEPVNGEWDPLPFDRMVDSMNAAGLNVLGVVAKAPDWALSEDPETFLANPAEFQQLMAFLADRYQGRVQAWEIWNEQNLAHEVGGYVNVDDYIAMLKAGSEGVRAGDPEALVVFGGLTPNGVNDPTVAIDDFNYLNLAYVRSGGEISQYFDILGAHANSTHNSPDETYPDNVTSGNEGWNDHPSFFFRRVEELRQVMVDQGDVDKPVWITEFGWTTENQAPGYEYGVNNSEEEVAEYLVRGLEICKDEWSWCTGAFIWNLNWSTLVDPSDEKYPWSAVEGDWTPLPQYEAIRDLLN